MVYAASFDIGKKNFCFYIEEFDIKELKNLKAPSLTSRYNPNGTMTDDMSCFVDSVCENGHTVLHKNLDLTNNCVKGSYLDPETFHNMCCVLNEYKLYFDKCSYIIIEMQMAFRGKYNTMALKLGQHCYSWFVCNYGREKVVVEFPAYYKTQILGAPKIEGKPYKSGKTRWKSMEKKDIKKWSVEKCIEILTSRGEIDVLDDVLTKTKKDDLADVLVQLQAWKIVGLIDEKN